MLPIADNKASMDAVEEVCECETMETPHLVSHVEPSTTASDDRKVYQRGIEQWVDTIKCRGSTPIESLKPYQEGLETWAESFKCRGISPLLHRSTDFIVSVTVETEIKVAVDAGYNWSSRNHGGYNAPHQKTTLKQELMGLQLSSTKDGAPGRCFIKMVEYIGITNFSTWVYQ